MGVESGKILILHLKWSSLMKSFGCKGVRPKKIEDITSGEYMGHPNMAMMPWKLAHLRSQRIWMEKPATFARNIGKTWSLRHSETLGGKQQRSRMTEHVTWGIETSEHR